ncbi:PaaI family thioesterase [Sphingomonas sanxanigenens]|uniref:Thioesterase domain-containing protein n=1 Tax=Sphingomonas sanxanigenens DSM 19645 = NX02 TaxID=1123269 RepID=W0AJD7_9SPHN|nr:PaaI family thioesterase [Sphingomonas sanxanigenens]AHE56662.1 hypothetical protein NX02_25275 [Sphingomonas sanxanigenens DSM 19645 = NX02]
MRALPPYADLLGLSIAELRDGMPLLTMPFGEAVLGRPGFVHGGAIAGLLEMAAFAALHASLADEADVTVKPVNVSVDYLRGGREKITYALGHVSRLGRRIANVDVSAWQDDPGAPIATARMTMLLRRG